MCINNSQNGNCPYANFGYKIWRARKALKMTREEVARLLGLDATHYKKIECGEVEATDQIKLELVHALGINL